MTPPFVEVVFSFASVSEDGGYDWYEPGGLEGYSISATSGLRDRVRLNAASPTIVDK